MKKILITGGSGFIGSHLVKKLKKNHDIFVLNKSEYKRERGCRTLIHDFTDDLPLLEFPSSVETIVHLASTRNYKNKDSEKEIFNVNVASTMKLIEEGFLNKIKHFIYVSTGGVYPLSNSIIDEKHRLINLKNSDHQPINFYFKTKLMAEAIVTSYSRKMKTTLIRPFFPFGENQNSTFLIPRIIQKIKQQKEVFINTDNDFKFNPIYVHDLVKVIETIINKRTTGLFNVCGDQSITIKELTDTTANFFKIKPKIKYFKENKINKLIGCNQKIKNITGIKFKNFNKLYPDYLNNIRKV